MRDVLPGTTVEADLRRPDAADMLLSPLFLTGGLMLSQVSQLTGLEPYVIQNWVKRGFVSPPERKKYSRRQFCRILFINMLKDVLQLEKICQLLSYVNGALADESDDLVDDSYLYTCLVACLGGWRRRLCRGTRSWSAGATKCSLTMASPVRAPGGG